MTERALEIQIAEDSAPIQELLVAHLEAIPGVRVTGISRSAGEALERLRQSPPGLLVLDLQLDGSSAFDILKDLPPAPRRPVAVVLTNHGGAETRAACAAAGADYFFDKSAEFSRFLDAVRRLAAGIAGPVLPADSYKM
jgi:DNA-binding NarL/FixJ family response regulator